MIAFLGFQDAIAMAERYYIFIFTFFLWEGLSLFFPCVFLSFSFMSFLLSER